MSTSRALLCSYSCPRPDGDSGSRRLYDLLTFLHEAGWQVTYRSCWNNETPSDGEGLARLGIEVDSGPDESWNERVAEAGFDLAVLAYWPVAEWYLPRIRKMSPQTRIIVDSVDLHWLREARQVYCRNQCNDGEIRLLEPSFGSQVVGEWNVYAAADMVLTVSDKESGLIREILGDSARPRTVPDCEDFQASPYKLAQRRGVVMVGSYNYLPNVEAAEYLFREILPRVDASLLTEHPVYVVGHGLGDRLRRAARGLKNVRLVGFVPSVEPYFQRCRISVVPLLFGAGTKRKMVQALMSGTPTVTTSVGAEGLDLCDGRHALIADRPDEFAVAITRLLQDPSLWSTLAAGGREHIVQRHGRESARARLLEAIEATLASPAKPAVLPDVDRQTCVQRVMYSQRTQEQLQIRRALKELAPAGAAVLVCADGNESSLQLPGLSAWPFPQSPEGAYVGNNVQDAVGAIAQLERLRAKGAGFFLVPNTSRWWLEYYAEFGRHLQDRYRELSTAGDSFRLFALDVAGGWAAPALAEKVPADAGPSAAEQEVRLIAFYLPQFHPIAENDAWWGEGFTEWTNVAKAQPLFDGHYQPHLPADLGFCDLRLPEVRQQQADMAREYGIHGFCYYHYWFQGTRLLERPFQEVLDSGQPDFPFCLCWANEPWSRRWNGQNEDVLQAQTYSEEDDRAHIRWLLPALRDRRAIRIEDKPAFLVYQAKQLPNPARTVSIWREEAALAGLPGLYLMTVETGWDAGWDATEAGFDAKVLFQPQFSMLFNSETRIDVPGKPTLRVFDYQRAWPILANPAPVGYRRYPAVFPRWDNTPRTGLNGVVLHDSTPEAYQQWLALTVENARKQPPEHRIVFVNAWNEWGEGCHLEPDQAQGLSYLEATRRALSSRSRMSQS